MIDIGANLTHDSFNKDRKQVIQAAVDAGVETMIVTGSNESCSQMAYALTQEFPEQLFATVGIHPHHASEYTGDTEDLILELVQKDKVVAIGETGLDYFRDISPRAAQVFSFEQHIKLAIETQMPLFLHQRDAHADFYPILKEHRDKLSNIVVHCFTDTKKALFDYLDLDCHIGITGWICDERRGLHLRELVKNIPDNRLMIETDSPYLIPRDLKLKTRRNEPRHLAHIAQVVAELKETQLDVFVGAITKTTQKFFRIYLA
ncbi:MAG: TatD family hydrolase [Alcanivoracaceae bacterium]|nr:TatD family hydrolase [Alcanivoracaceae bacterium]